MKTQSTVLVTVLLLLGVQTVIAEMLFDNGDPTWGYGVAILSELDTFNQIGDDFDLADDAILSAVVWWGSASGNDFRIRIFRFDDATPESTPLMDLDVGVLIGTAETFSGGPRQRYRADIPALPLEAGRYLLSIVDQSSEETWFWDASCEDGCETFSWRRPLDGDAWSSGNFSMSFRLEGQLALVSDAQSDLPSYGLALRNVPNPFNPTTTIHFELSRASDVRLRIYDTQGRLVRQLLNRQLSPGAHSIVWDGTSNSAKGLGSGVYLYQLETERSVTRRKMLLLK